MSAAIETIEGGPRGDESSDSTVVQVRGQGRAGGASFNSVSWNITLDFGQAPVYPDRLP